MLKISHFASHSGRPLWSIGLIADVQYADRDPVGSCYYREALGHLSATIEAFNAQELVAVVNLGDVVDTNEPEPLERVGAVFDRNRHPLIHLLGNHDHLGPQDGAAVARRLAMGWGRVETGEVAQGGGWRLFALDSTEISVESAPEGSGLWRRATEELHALQAEDEPCAQFWNGRAGEAQMAALAECLRAADAGGERVIIFNHMPAHPGAASARHLCWNHRQLCALLGDHRSAVAHINGHDHDGGYQYDAGTRVHFLTLPAVCDSGPGPGAAALLHAYPDRLELEGWGRVASRVLRLA